MIYKLLRQHLGRVVIATVCSLLLGAVSTILFSLVGPALQVILNPHLEYISITDLFGPYLGNGIGWLLDVEGVEAKALWETLPILLGVCAILRGGLMMTQWSLWEQASERMAASLRERLVNSYLHIDPQTNFDHEGFDQRLSTILTTDVKFTREYIIHFYGGLPRELIQVVFYLVTLMLLSPQLFIVFMLGVAPAGIILSKLGKKIRRRSEKALDTFGQLGEWLQQRLLGVETIKQLGTELVEANKLTGLTSHLNDKFLKISRVKARTAPLLETLAVSVIAGILYLSLGMVAEGIATGSVLMSFFSILGILSQSASKLGRYYNSNKEGGAAAKRIVQLEELMVRNRASSIPLKKHESRDISIQVKDIYLKYPHQESWALKGVSCQFQSGKIYCLCGPSGAGKSSLFSVLLGLIEPSDGVISFSSHLDRSDLGYLPQTMTLAPASLKENMSYPSREFDREVALQAFDAASIEEDLRDRFDDTKQSQLEDLSGGQMQRVFLARLFYRRFAIVLIDEGTSALDPENEAAIYQSVRKMADEGSTVVMIAHRISSMKMADTVLLLEDGCLKAQGPFEALKHQAFFQGM